MIKQVNCIKIIIRADEETLVNFETMVNNFSKAYNSQRIEYISPTLTTKERVVIYYKKELPLHNSKNVEGKEQ